MKRGDFLVELRAMNVDQLVKKLEELKVSLYRFRVSKKFGQLSQNHLFKHGRANIARLKFVISEKKRVG